MHLAITTGASNVHHGAPHPLATFEEIFFHAASPARMSSCLSKHSFCCTTFFEFFTPPLDSVLWKQRCRCQRVRWLRLNLVFCPLFNATSWDQTAPTHCHLTPEIGTNFVFWGESIGRPFHSGGHWHRRVQEKTHRKLNWIPFSWHVAKPELLPEVGHNWLCNFGHHTFSLCHMYESFKLFGAFDVMKQIFFNCSLGLWFITWNKASGTV